MRVIARNCWLYCQYASCGLLAFFLLASVNMDAAAQDSTAITYSPAVQKNILEIARVIETRNLIIKENANSKKLTRREKERPHEFLARMRVKAMQTTINIYGEKEPEIISQYAEMAKRFQSPPDIAIADMFARYNDARETLTAEQRPDALLKYYAGFFHHRDWFVANRARLFAAIIHGERAEYDDALNNATQAILLISHDHTQPETFPAMYEAMYESSDVVGYLHVHTNNPAMATNAIADLISSAEKLGREIDGVNILNNFIYLMERWHEYEIAKSLSEILLRLNQTNQLSTIDLARFRYGKALNNVAEYEKAGPVLGEALRSTKNMRLRLPLEIQFLVAQAGIGDTGGMEKTKARIAKGLESIGQPANKLQQYQKRANTVLAIQQGRTLDAVGLLAEQSRQELHKAFLELGQRAQKGVAKLENSEERQAERANAAEALAELEKERADAQRKVTWLLGATFMMGLLIIGGCVGVYIWRQRTDEEISFLSLGVGLAERAKAQFMAVMSHELRTPLNGIIGISDLLTNHMPENPVKEQTQIIFESGKDLLDMITGILDMADLEEGKISVATKARDIRILVNDIFKEYAPRIDEGRVKFTCFIDPEVPADLMIDEIRLVQAIDQMVSNAVKFTHRGRIHIHITMGPAVLDQNAANVRLVRIIVADTGIGVPVDVQETLYRPFVQANSSTTREYNGAGVGLTLTRLNARLMGGDITLKSRLGYGSEFMFTFKSCRVEDAEIDPETGGPRFEMAPIVDRKVDFSPAKTVESMVVHDDLEKQAAAKDSVIKAGIMKSLREGAERGDQDDQPLVQASLTLMSNPNEDSSAYDLVPNTEIGAIAPPPFADEVIEERGGAAAPKDLDSEILEQIARNRGASSLGTDNEIYSTQRGAFAKNSEFAMDNSIDEQELWLSLSPGGGRAEGQSDPAILDNVTGEPKQGMPPFDLVRHIDQSDPIFSPAKAGSTPKTSETFAHVRPIVDDRPDTAKSHRGIFSRREAREDSDMIGYDQIAGLNILIVEDVLANQEIIRSLLEPVGCGVSSAFNGVEALDLLESQVFDVILMDIRMPVMDGIEATRRIRATSGPHRNVPIIALTADAAAGTNAQCLAAGADVFLTKPVVVSELFGSIRFARQKQARTVRSAITG